MMKQIRGSRLIIRGNEMKPSTAADWTLERRAVLSEVSPRFRLSQRVTIEGSSRTYRSLERKDLAKADSPGIGDDGTWASASLKPPFLQ